MNQAWKRRFCWVTRSKLSILWAELVAAVRRRGRGECSDDEEDLGLPRSPPASPPTDKADKRHHAGISQSSCSDGSLLSVGSSEMDEDSSSGHHHSHDHSARSDHSDVYNVSEPPSGVAPLSHSAARHKMAVRPRRTHGAPRRKKTNQIAASALPITPELNEEMTRSTTPDVTHKTSEVVTESFSSSTTTKHQIYAKEQHLQLNRELQRVLEPPSDTKMKSSSLPPGLALGQVVQSPAKLSIAESNTPRSSIKRSKSSTQDQPLRESSPKIQSGTAETQIHTYHSEERMAKYRIDKKHADETCLEKKSKSEKKIENEDVKKTKTDKPQYKTVEVERSDCPDQAQAYRPVPAERTHKTAGQKAFANQLHKRIDKQGAYVQDSAYKDVYSAAKVPGMEYSITDLKIAEETDVMLNLEMKSRYSRREEIERVEKRRSTSKDAVDSKRESFNLHLDRNKRPASVQRLMDPFPTKAFISNEISQLQGEQAPALEAPNEVPIRAVRKPTPEYGFHSGSMPKNLYFNPSVIVSPPKISQSSDNVKASRSEQEYRDRKESRESFRASHAEGTPTGTPPFGLRSLGDEYVEARGGIGKSHSFRYASESTSISSQENQMPSLPAIVGISEPLLESWEVNYRRNVTERDYSKRVSARNYNIQANQEANYDSLLSTDSSYLDSLKVEEDRKLFTSIHVTMDGNKRDSDISQIEAKIDDIIGSPKPIVAPIIKSSSLDSVKGSPGKNADDRRKTISVESAASSNKPAPKDNRQEENFVSVTHVNRELTPVAVKNIEASKVSKSDERLQKSGASKAPGVPEFLNIQLNKVDAKPATNVVLTANVTPKRDSPQQERESEIEILPVTETKIASLPIAKDNTKTAECVENNTIEEKVASFTSKSAQGCQTPRSPSTPREFFKRKSTSVELQDRPEKPRTNSLSTEGSTEKIYDNISIDRKSHSSYGSKSSIQSSDSTENRTSDRQEEVVYRKKPTIGKEIRGDRKRDDEPELMKVFARRSLKIKDTEADSLAREIADAEKTDGSKSKVLKNEFNASIKSRDSDKENEVKPADNLVVDIAARVSQYQRSASVHSVASAKRDSAPCRGEVNRYKKEVSDSTPEKRLRNRTFPDPSNDREMAKGDAMPGYRADTLTKRPWQRKEDFRLEKEKEKREETDAARGEGEKGGAEKERKSEGEADASPQFKGILQMRAEWERRAKQGMTK
ncbi:unnamed protein product, partial [Iphiclides podalirius]